MYRQQAAFDVVIQAYEPEYLPTGAPRPTARRKRQGVDEVSESPEDLQIGRGFARLRDDVRKVFGDHVQFSGRYAIRRTSPGAASGRSALSYAYDPEHAADHASVVGRNRSRNARRNHLLAKNLKCDHISTNARYLRLGVIMFAFNMSSPVDVIRGLSERMKRRRIQHGLTQRELAARSNVSYGSLRLFEESGKISLESLVKIAFVLEAEAEFDHLFPSRPPQNIDDVVDRPLRQRVRRK